MERNRELGSMLTELLLSIALMALILPFVFRAAGNRIRRAEDIASARDIAAVQGALEKYMTENKKEFFKPVNKTIMRVKLSDLDLPENLRSKEYQLRIVKTADRGGRAVLQGVVVISGGTPLRTAQIAELAGANLLESGKFGISGGSGGVFAAKSTRAVVSDSEYLQRLPSEIADDAAMKSPLAFAENDIKDIGTLQARELLLDKILSADAAIANKISFATRQTIDGEFLISGEAIVNGAMTSDGRNLEISRDINLDQTGNFSLVAAQELTAKNLNLSGFSVSSSEKNPAISVGGTIDMTGGYITAEIAHVGFSGSITPRISITDGISDGQFYWNAENGTADLADVYVPVLNQMARAVEKDRATESGKIFSSVAANANATAADFIRAIDKMRALVEQKYQLLNLQ